MVAAYYLIAIAMVLHAFTTDAELLNNNSDDDTIASSIYGVTSTALEDVLLKNLPNKTEAVSYLQKIFTTAYARCGPFIVNAIEADGSKRSQILRSISEHHEFQYRLFLKEFPILNEEYKNIDANGGKSVSYSQKLFSGVFERAIELIAPLMDQSQKTKLLEAAEKGKGKLYQSFRDYAFDTTNRDYKSKGLQVPIPNGVS